MKRLLIVLMMLIVPALAFGQAETTARISGSVVDQDGNPVPGASVELSSDAMLGTRELTTNANGNFLATLLPVGMYSVTVTAPGKQPVTTGVPLKIGQNTPITITMVEGELMTEEVTVYGTATPMTTTVLGENFNYDNTIEELPIQDRSIERVAEFAPNVSFGPTPDTLSIAGAPSYDTTVLLDGAEISDPYFGSAAPIFLEDALEEVQVLTGGLPARYGRFQGGVINATSKAGGNTFTGTVRAEFGKESWNSTTPFHEEQSDDLNQLYQATLGGYMLKDHLWFFAGYRTAPTADDSTTTIGTGESFTTTSDEDRWQVKLTGAINANHTIAASYFDSKRDQGTLDGLPAGDLFALAPREDPRTLYTATYQGVLTERAFLDVQATKKDIEIISGGSTVTSAGFPEGRSPFLDFYVPDFAIYNNHWWDAADPSVRDNQTASANMTHVLSAGSWGDHTVEYGIQYVDSETAGLNNQSPTGFNLLNYDAYFGLGPFADCTGSDCTFNLTSFFSLPTGGLSYRWQAVEAGKLEQQVESVALYLQDSWQWQDWRFDLGLRYDHYDLSAKPFTTLDASFDEISPRLGVTYNINPNWQLQASWGKYVSRFNDNVASSVSGVGGAPYVVSIYTGPDVTGQSYEQVEALLRDDANFGLITTVNDPAQPIRFVGDDVTAPYANDLNLSVKHSLPRNTGSFVLSYTRRDFEDLLDDIVGDEGSVIVADPFGSGATLAFDQIRWDNVSEAERRYEALTANFDYRPGAKWNVGGNWTYAWNEGNYEGEGRNTPSSGSIIGNYERSVNQDLAVPFGYLDEDIRHRVNAFGSYRFDFERAGQLTLGSTALYESARNWSRTGALGFSPDPDGVYLNNQGSYTAFFDGRGNDRFNDWWALNASARYQFTFHKDLGMWVKLNVLNVLNNDEVITWQTSGSADTSGAFPVWVASGNCAPGDSPSVDCTDWGHIRNQDDYQVPRTYLVTLGISF